MLPSKPYLSYPVATEYGKPSVCIRIGSDGGHQPLITVSITDHGFFTAAKFLKLYRMAADYAHDKSKPPTHLKATENRCCTSRKYEVNLSLDADIKDADFNIQMLVEYRRERSDKTIVTRLSHETCENIVNGLEALEKSGAAEALAKTIASAKREERLIQEEEDADDEDATDDLDEEADDDLDDAPPLADEEG